MAEGFATPEHRVLPSYFGTAGVPDFQGSTDKEIAKWWNKRLGSTVSMGNKLLANGASNWMGMEDLTVFDLTEPPYDALEKDATAFVKIVQKVGEAYVKDEAQRDSAQRYRSEMSAEAAKTGSGLGHGGAVAAHTTYPTVVHSGKGLWPAWEEARVVIATLQGWIEINNLSEAGCVVDSLVADIVGTKVDDAEQLAGVSERQARLVYGAMMSLLTVAQKLKVPADLQTKRNGFELVSFYGKKCHGDDMASAEIDQYDWENPDSCKTAEQVSLWLVEWENLYRKINLRGTDYSTSDSDT